MRNSGLVDRQLDDVECEGFADEFLRRIGCRSVSTVDPIDLLARHRVELDPRAPSGCRGLVELDPPRVRFSTQGSVEVIYATLAHEAGHLAIDAAAARRRAAMAACERCERSHGEGDATRVAQAFCYPYATVQRVLRAHGLDLARIAAICPAAPLEWAALRAAWVAGRAVQVNTGRRALTWAPTDRAWPERWRCQLAAGVGGCVVSEAASRRGDVVRAVWMPCPGDGDDWPVMTE
jgi:hypothetical protein